MMPIYTVPTPTEKTEDRRQKTEKSDFRPFGSALVPAKLRAVAGQDRLLTSGYVLAEMLMVLVIIALFVSLATLNVSGLIGKSRFKAQAQGLIDVMRMAVTAAAETNKRYEIIFDVAEQTYTLRQITSPDLSEILEDDIIQTGNFTENCQLSYVQFDDFWRTDEDFELAFFRAGHSGWQAGGKIVLLDSRGQEHSIVANRLNRIIELKKGDVELLMPKDDVFF